MKSMFGEDPLTLTAIANLSLVLDGLGKHRGAIELMERCTKLRTQLLGPEHLDTKSSSLTLQKWKKRTIFH
jgi:hypothetical protein